MQPITLTFSLNLFSHILHISFLIICTQPGFMVYRHLHCATFSEEILTAEDVENYETLNEEDYIRLSEQVEVSKERIKEEREELRPDELVQKSFTGEIRNEPKGLTATLLPFQVEGFSWMRHQEVMEEEIRGGILADEMGELGLARCIIFVAPFFRELTSSSMFSIFCALFPRHGKDYPGNSHNTRQSSKVTTCETRYETSAH